jgi:hypothetical protein
MAELRFTDLTQQSLVENFKLDAESLAKLNFALNLSGTTHAVESLQTHCELSQEHAESLAVVLHLLSSVNYTDQMILKQKDAPTSTENLSKTTVYIRNLPLTVTPEELSEGFEVFGAVREIRTQKDKISGEFSGYVASIILGYFAIEW